jgi:hypothetical protein
MGEDLGKRTWGIVIAMMESIEMIKNGEKVSLYGPVGMFIKDNMKQI